MMAGYTVTFRGERTLVSGERALEAIVTGIAMGLGSSAQEARKRAQDACRGATAEPGSSHHQWLAEDAWVRIDREWEQT